MKKKKTLLSRGEVVKDVAGKIEKKNTLSTRDTKDTINGGKQTRFFTMPWFRTTIVCLGRRSLLRLRTGSNSTKQLTFGIIAALTNDRVIGIDGGLPWKINSNWKEEYAPAATACIQLDRDRFVTLTRNKILIMGRKTFADEDPTGAHVKHARVCIVISKTMNPLVMGNDGPNVSVDVNNSAGPIVMLARSFDEALEKATNELYSVDDESSHSDQGEILNDEEVQKIQCWVAGGEMIYKEALQHCKANVVHLTHVDMTVKEATHHSITHFPVEYLERYGFQEMRRESTGSPRISFCLYKKHCRK